MNCERHNRSGVQYLTGNHHTQAGEKMSSWPLALTMLKEGNQAGMLIDSRGKMRRGRTCKRAIACLETSSVSKSSRRVVAMSQWLV